MVESAGYIYNLMYRKEKLLENRDFIIIGENIRRLRKSKNYTQEYLAEKLDISSNHVYRIENAEAHISMPLLLKIKQLFEVDANELLEEHDNEEKEILFKKNPLHSLKSMTDIQTLLAGCTEQEQELLLCNLYQLCDLLKASRHS